MVPEQRYTPPAVRKAIPAKRLAVWQQSLTPRSIIFRRPAPLVRHVDRGDGDRPYRPPGVRSARTAAAGRHRTSRPSVPCTACGAQTRAAFPEGVTAPVQYGTRIAAFVVYLLHYQLLPEKRLAELMADLFGVNLVTATIAGMSQDLCRAACRASLSPCAITWRQRRSNTCDETGFRIGGKTQWLHIASTILLTFYRISPKRGSLPLNVTGIVVHDHWKPYYTLKGVLHALCNAHHLA